MVEQGEEGTITTRCLVKLLTKGGGKAFQFYLHPVFMDFGLYVEVANGFDLERCRCSKRFLVGSVDLFCVLVIIVQFSFSPRL